MQFTGVGVAVSDPGVNSVRSIMMLAGVIGHPKLFVGVSVNVTCPVATPSGVHVTVCGSLLGAVAVPSIFVLLNVPILGLAVHSPVYVSVT